MKSPKRMLIELPTADEIDDLAMSTPELSVRKFEYDRRKAPADLNYTPCKGQMVLVIRGENGTLLVKRGGTEGWSLPSGLINTYEKIEDAPRRLARELCGLSLKSMDLTAIYDIVWHFKDVSIKRLHVVYAGLTDDTACAPATEKGIMDASFHKDVSESMLGDEVDRTAIDDCSEK